VRRPAEDLSRPGRSVPLSVSFSEETTRTVQTSRRRLRRRWPGVGSGLSVGDARPAHAGPHPHGRQIEAAHTSRRPVHLAAVFLAPDCPARGHRVKGGPTGRRFAQTLTRRPLTRIRRLRGRRTGLGGRFCRRCFQVPFEAGPYSLFLVSAHPGDEWTQQLKGALRSHLA
jgi:hypothetical protein